MPGGTSGCAHRFAFLETSGSRCLSQATGDKRFHSARVGRLSLCSEALLQTLCVPPTPGAGNASHKVFSRTVSLEGAHDHIGKWNTGARGFRIPEMVPIGGAPTGLCFPFWGMSPPPGHCLSPAADRYLVVVTPSPVAGGRHLHPSPRAGRYLIVIAVRGEGVNWWAGWAGYPPPQTLRPYVHRLLDRSQACTEACHCGCLHCFALAPPPPPPCCPCALVLAPTPAGEWRACRSEVSPLVYS